ncbi:MAG: hypothetical protein MK329_17140, partial [Pirellulales bacterium]|nr:hypothetical protein [Pirellulales bacterium]
MRNSIMTRLFIVMLMLLAIGCGTRSENENIKLKQNTGVRKTVLTAEEVASLFDNEIGRWKITGKNIP